MFSVKFEDSVGGDGGRRSVLVIDCSPHSYGMSFLRVEFQGASLPWPSQTRATRKVGIECQRGVPESHEDQDDHLTVSDVSMR